MNQGTFIHDSLFFGIRVIIKEWNKWKIKLCFITSDFRDIYLESNSENSKENSD